MQATVTNIESAKLQRLSFQIPQSLLSEIDELAALDGSNRTEVFKRALKWYSFVQTKLREGKHVFIGKTPSEIETQVVPLG